MSKSIKVIVIIAVIALAAVLGLTVIKDAVEEKMYPLEYEDIIVAKAEKYNLDPYLVCAMIKTESGFDETAVSPVGAQGLMQIMPETADWIAEKLEMTSYDIFDPETNIEFGCWYLSFLQEKFSSQNTIIAAYNAGHGKVAEWLEGEHSADGENLDDIPYEETEKYVGKVARAYEKYKELYKIG